MRLRTGYTSYLATTLDYRESAQIPAETLAALVARLRRGDDTVAAAIIKGHLRLVAAIVGEMVLGSKRDDALGAALLALVEAVGDARERLYDDNITAYVTTTVKYAVKDFLAHDHVVRVPGRTVRYRIAKGDRFEDIVPGDSGQVREGDDRACDGLAEEGVRGKNPVMGFTLPYTIPLAKPIEPSPEFKEAVAKAPANPMEQAILKLRMEGCGYEEIGERVGLSYQRIGQIVPPLVARFEALIK